MQTDFIIDSFFKELKKNGRIRASKCATCGYTVVLPRPICTKCNSKELTWFDLPMAGEVVGFSEIHVTNEEFQSYVPYVIAIVDLGGTKIPGIIKNVHSEHIRIGAKVNAVTSRKSRQIGPAYWFELA